MEQPPGYQTKDVNWVWKLLKTLYGCKQSPREAGKKLREVLKLCLLQQHKSDPNSYFLFNDGFVLIMANFVDDTICGVSKNSMLKEDFLKVLRTHFEIEVTENPTEFLGFELVRDRPNRKLQILQTGYMKSLLRQYQMMDCRPLKTPWCNVKFPAPSTIKKEECYEYQELVGAMIWLTHTRKDLNFYISVLCRYMSRFGKNQWDLAVNVLRYIAGTSSMGLMYDLSEVPVPAKWGEGVVITPWVDSNFAERESDSKSSSGLVFQLNGCTIDAQCLLQKRPAQDTAESEWYGFQAMCKWVEWYRGFLSELQIDLGGRTIIKHDNQAVKSLLEDNSKLGRTLHWRIAQHYPRYLYDIGVVGIEYCPTDQMIADMQNKALPFPALSRHRRKIQGE
jgi:hypothetical protein